MRRRYLAPILFALTALPGGAVIVAGASGGGDTSNNTTAAQYLAETGNALPVFDNVVQYSDAGGVYLGYNAVTHDVWVLSARHVTANPTAGSTITIDGLSYNRQTDGIDGYGHLVGGDLRLVRYRRGDLAVPSLPAIPLSSTMPAAGTPLVMIGYGQNRTENATTSAFTSDATSTTVGTGYHWSGTNLKRWGTNEVEAEFPDVLESGTPVAGTTGTVDLGAYTTVGFITDFDEPAVGDWLASNEAQASVGDSGGGTFIYSGGQWLLSGIFTAVADFGGQDANSAAFGNGTVVTNVNTYQSAIQTALGTTLIPEPGALALLALGAPALLRRRRR